MERPFGEAVRKTKADTHVSAWVSKAKAVFGQLDADEKSNETTAVPELLELLYIEGYISTADAMICQKATRQYHVFCIRWDYFIRAQYRHELVPRRVFCR